MAALQSLASRLGAHAGAGWKLHVLGADARVFS
jgi:hypothetical protein